MGGPQAHPVPGLRSDNAAEISISFSFPQFIDNWCMKDPDDNGLEHAGPLMKERAVPVVELLSVGGCKAQEQPTIPQHPTSAASRSEQRSDEQSGNSKSGGWAPMLGGYTSAGGPRLGTRVTCRESRWANQRYVAQKVTHAYENRCCSQDRFGHPGLSVD